jgi:poly(3-hydroxybutyrate) depolymerase
MSWRGDRTPETPPSSSWRLQTRGEGSTDASSFIHEVKKSACPPGDDISKLIPFEVVNDGGGKGGGGGGSLTKMTTTTTTTTTSRSFYVYSPPHLCSVGGYDLDDDSGRDRMRIILAIHGYTGRPRQEIEKWHDVAASLDAIVIAPEGTPTAGVGLGWNAIQCCGTPMRDEVDDLDFVINGAVGIFLDSLRDGGTKNGNSGGAVYNGGAVIATGFSNGGFLSSLLGLLSAEGDHGRPSWLVGVVPTGGYQYDAGLYGGPSGPRPMPVMSHHGGKDSVVDPDGCCAPDDGSESNCAFDIGIKQKTCTSVKRAFEMWADINRCSNTVLDDEIVNVRQMKNVDADQQLMFNCWKGEGCVEPTNFCLWNEEGHSWGNRFPGTRMTEKWMEDVFRRAESRTNNVVHSKSGRIVFSSTFAFLMVILFCTTVNASRLRKLSCFVGKGRKRKLSEGYCTTTEGNQFT